MLPNYDLGDILIKRVQNGWLVVTGSDTEEGKTQTFVYEDPSEPNWTAKSLHNLLVDQFEGYMQSKHSSGIKIEFAEMSKSEEEDEDLSKTNF